MRASRFKRYFLGNLFLNETYFGKIKMQVLGLVVCNFFHTPLVLRLFQV